MYHDPMQQQCPCEVLLRVAELAAVLSLTVCQPLVNASKLEQVATSFQKWRQMADI
jgi:hypothetical protein